MKNLSSHNETGFLHSIKETVSKHPLAIAVPTALMLFASGVKSAIADSLCFALDNTGKEVVGTQCGSGDKLPDGSFTVDGKGVLTLKGISAETFEQFTFTRKLTECTKIRSNDVASEFDALASGIEPTSARKCEFELPRAEKACVGISPSRTELKTDCEGNDFPGLKIDRPNGKIYAETIDPSKGPLGTPQRSSASLNGSNCKKIPDSEVSAKLGSPIYAGSNGFECVLTPEKPLTVTGPAEVPSKEKKMDGITIEVKAPPKPSKPSVKDESKTPTIAVSIEVSEKVKDFKTPVVADLITQAWDKLNQNTESTMFEAESLYFELGAVLTTDEQKKAHSKLGRALKEQKAAFNDQREFVTGERTVTVPVVTEKGEEVGEAKVRANILKVVRDYEKKLRK